MASEIFQKHNWITSTFFEKVLRKELGDPTLFVKTFEIVLMAGREQNYWCDVYKIAVNYTNSSKVVKSDHFLLKVGYYDSYMSQELERFNTFKRELAFHKIIKPKIDELMENAGDSIVLTTRSLCVVDLRPQPKYLLLEDLRFHGYHLVDRRSGFDMAHLKLLLGKLAKIHAITAVLHTTIEENLMRNHYEQNINENFRTFHSLFLNCLRSCAEEADDWEESRKYVEKLQALEKNFIEKCSDAFVLDPLAFGVLNHGDLTTSNILFRMDNENRPTDVLITNFELSFFGSPGIDLAYLFFTSTSSTIKDYEFDILLQLYHKNLHENLIKYNYQREIPSLTDIHNEFLKHGIIGVAYSMLLIPLRYATSPNQFNLKILVENSAESLELRKSFFQVRAFKERMQFLLDYYDRKGFLD